MPVPNLAIDHHTGHQPQSARLARRGRGLELHGERVDFLFQAHQNRLAVSEQFFHPLRYGQRGESAWLPPPLHRLDPVIDDQTAPLRFESFARFDQLLPLPVDGAQLFFFRRGHPHHRQRFRVTFHIPIQL